MRRAWILLFLLASAAAQQPPDEDFRFANPRPAYAAGKGPRVCLDLEHHTFPSANRNPSAYRPFMILLKDDGYRVQETSQKFTPASLAECDLLVIADATGDDNLHDWAFPHPSAFTRAEIEALYRWIRNGGGLLLIADHAPTPGAAADLGTLLGLVLLDGYARNVDAPPPDVFSRASGHLLDHAILRGRSESERVDAVATFTGHSFQASREWSPLLKFGPEAFAYVDVGRNFPDIPGSQRPRFSVGNWWHAAARRLEKGRVVWLGEVSICTALRLGEERRPVGMNHPEARQNAQFCLNVARWLSGALDD